MAKSKERLNSFLDEENHWEITIGKITEGDCTPFFGSKISDFTMLAEISQQLAEKYEYPFSDNKNLSNVTQYISIIKGDQLSTKYEVKSLLEENSNDIKDYEFYQYWAQLPIPIYITANYDDLLSKALRKEGKEPKIGYCCWNQLNSDNKRNIDSKFEPTENTPLVYHLHGTIEDPGSLVLTKDDYINFLVEISKDINKIVHHRILRSLASTNFIFNGYNLEDFTYRTLSSNVAASLTDGKNISVQIPTWKRNRKKEVERFNKIKEFLENYNLAIFNAYTVWKEPKDYVKELFHKWKICKM